MPIIFAENFQQDTPETITKRYPGSTRLPTTNATDVPTAWPVNQGSVLQFGTVPFTEGNDRFEVRMHFSNTFTDTTTASPFYVFGIEFVYATPSTLSVEGREFPFSMDAQSMNIIIERTTGDRFLIIVLVGDEVVVTPTIMQNGWTPTSWIGGGSRSSVSRLGNWPNLITNIVVAVDTAHGTYLNDVQFHKRELGIVDPGDWSFTDTGFVEDTDKADPLDGDPRIETPSTSAISFDFIDELEPDITNVYVNRGSERPEIGIAINGSLGPTLEELTVAAVQKASASINIEAVALEPGALTNGDIVFYGERTDIISYADLATAVGLSVGTLMAGNTWLDFLIDGKRILVAKTPVRHSVSWDQIYAAGLVYGVDGPGTFPGTAGPVNQNKTIEIGGRVYRVRLLKGVDTDPSVAGSGTDLVGSHNSEWTRIFAPIGATDFPSYTGPKLANYSDAELGVGGSLNGRISWCQETHPITKINRYNRGAGALSTISYTDIATGGNARSWRPCLELVV